MWLCFLDGSRRNAVKNAVTDQSLSSPVLAMTQASGLEARPGIR
jgi:hypothetical protein